MTSTRASMSPIVPPPRTATPVAQHLAVGAARGGRPHLHEHLVDGLVDVVDTQVVGTVQDRRAHHAAAPVRPSVSSRVACVRRVSWHGYHATSSAGAPSRAMS